MATGSEIARNLASRRSDVERQMRKVGNDIATLERELGKLMSEETALWNRFAVIQIGEKAPLPPQVEHLLGKRAQKIEEAKAAIAEAEARIADLERNRSVAALAADDKAEEWKKLRVVAEKEFENDPEAAGLRVDLAHLDETVESLASKLERATNEMEEKGKAYLEDELFRYLHVRKFGTGEYAAWGLVARLDSWLANLTSFRKKAAEYKRLSDIPVWIHERLAKVRTDRDAKDIALSTIHDRVFSPAAPALAAFEKAKEELAEIDAAIVRFHDTVHSSSKFITDAALASDQEMKTATKALADFLGRKGIRDLADAARRTSTQEDDEIVFKLRELEVRKGELNTQIDNLRPGLHEFERRARAIEEIERKMRSRGWTGYNDRFSGRVSSKIDDLASGMITAGSMWSTIESAYEAPRRSSYESSSYGSSSRSSSSSSSDSSWSSGGGFGGGSSWSSGGGFGGSDSSTGGGF